MGFFGTKVATKYGEDWVPNVKRIVIAAVGGVLGLILGLNILFGSWYTVDAGERAVVLRLGAINRTADQGLHLKLPFAESTVKISVRIGKAEAESTASSKDLQVVHTKIAVNYSPDPAQVATLYRTLGTGWEGALIDPMINEVFKSVTAKFTAEQLIGKRHEASLMIEHDLRERLMPFGFIIHNIAITNFDFSKTFNEAIEAKQTAEQLALKAMHDLDRVKREAEQRIAFSQAEAEALRLQRQNATAELIQLRAVEKWNGVMPQIVGTGAMPFINVKGEDR